MKYVYVILNVPSCNYDPSDSAEIHAICTSRKKAVEILNELDNDWYTVDKWSLNENSDYIESVYDTHKSLMAEYAAEWGLKQEDSL